MSREIDIQIAQKIFGYKVKEDFRGFKQIFIIKELGTSWEDNSYGNLPHYYSNLKDTDILLRKLKELGYYIVCETDSQEWSVSLFKDNKDYESKDCLLSCAICKAALESIKSAKRKKSKRI